MNSSMAYEILNSGEMIVSYYSHSPDSEEKPIHYDVKVYYRGVLLNDVSIQIPRAANILTVMDMAVNILSADFKPSVTRRGLTDEQKQVLSYALGRAMHIYFVHNVMETGGKYIPI